MLLFINDFNTFFLNLNTKIFKGAILHAVFSQLILPTEVKEVETKTLNGKSCFMFKSDTLTSKRDTLVQCWADVGLSPTTLAQHRPSIGSTPRVCWVDHTPHAVVLLDREPGEEISRSGGGGGA